MFRRIAFAALLILSAFLIGCADEDITRAPLGTVFTINYGQTIAIEDEGVRIGFSGEIYDSRCPANAYCFWPGQVEIELWMKAEDMDTVYSTAILFSNEPAYLDYNKPAVFPCYEVELLSLSPYPIDPGNIPLRQYSATVRVNKISCEPGEPPVKIVYLTWMAPSSIQVDQFDLNTAEFSADTLELNVSYSGGCYDHSFNLFMSPPVFMESNPVQANLYLRHRGFDDPCDAIVSTDLKFDIKSVVGFYYAMYGSHDPIIFNIYDYFEDQPGDKITLLYTPSE